MVMEGERAVWGLGYSNFQFEKGWMARGSWSWGGTLKIESSFGWFDSWVWEYLPQACPSSFPRLGSKSRDILRFAEDAVLALARGDVVSLSRITETDINSKHADGLFYCFCFRLRF